MARHGEERGPASVPLRCRNGTMLSQAPAREALLFLQGDVAVVPLCKSPYNT